MSKVGNLFVGNQLFCGVAEHLGAPLPPVGLGVGLTKIRGAGFIAGPLLVGSPFTFTKGPNVNEANLMVARCGNAEALPPPPSILKVSSFGFPPTPIDVVVGDPTGPVGVSVNSILINIISPITNGLGVLNWVGAKTFAGVKQQTGVELRAGAVADVGKEATTGNVVENGSRVINGALVVNGATHINGFLSFTSSIVGTTKKFDIPHPTKQNHRLAHACIEGPENGVYHRGRLIDTNVIQLPEYWGGLVDAETITVNLTPHGVYQELFVKSIEWGTKINVVNNLGGPINCSYTVYAKRKDVADLVVEYEGNEVKHWDLKGK
jgi:hypothetical protein